MTCPKINSFTQGIIEIDGILYYDVKIYPDKVEKWDWFKTDTHNDPGIQVKDVQDLLDYGCDFIILSRGLSRRVDVGFDTYKLLLKYEVDFLVTYTISAINRYKEETYDESHLVGALIHTAD